MKTTMTITAQDGRKINLSREHRLHIGGYCKNSQHGAVVTATLFTKSKWDDVPYSERHKYRDYEPFPARKIVADFDVIGTYTTNTGREKAADMLQKAWQSGATEFIMPQDNGEKSGIEIMEDFAEANNLTLCSINEVGYRPSDVARNLHIWRTTNEFERRNIIICDRYGDYSKSLAKWKALQACSKATEKSA